jgi:hypothetical protein
MWIVTGSTLPFFQWLVNDPLLKGRLVVAFKTDFTGNTCSG